MTLDDLIKKYYAECCQARINAYRRLNADSAAGKSDLQIKEELKLNLTNNDFLASFILYCASREIEEEERKAEQDLISQYRNQELDANSLTDQEILSKIQLNYSLREEIAQRVYGNMISMLKNELKELNEDYESTMDAINDPKISGEARSELRNSDIPGIVINIGRVQTSLNTLQTEEGVLSRKNG